jgi:hypothetical protein
VTEGSTLTGNETVVPVQNGQPVRDTRVEPSLVHILDRDSVSRTRERSRETSEIIVAETV